MNKKQIGELIAAERARQQLTQQQVADKAGIRRQSIIEVEQDQYNYRVDRLMEILDALGLDLIIAKKDSTMATAVVTDDNDMFLFRGVKPLLEDPDQPNVKRK